MSALYKRINVLRASGVEFKDLPTRDFAKLVELWVIEFPALAIKVATTGQIAPSLSETIARGCCLYIRGEYQQGDQAGVAAFRKMHSQITNAAKVHIRSIFTNSTEAA
ncbi:MAG: hypothetical protein HYX63_01440 [Gammaproteobacteria bacterium]|nr:hypothetical protein [Gammaproteobacteria bacterium]